MKFKKIRFMAGGILISNMIPSEAFCATNGRSNEDLWSIILIYGVLLLMIFLAIRLIKNAYRLEETAFRNTEKGSAWINQKLYDFDAEQLEILIREVNKMQNHKQIKEAK